MFTKEIKRTGKLTIDKNELRETFQNFTNVYDSLPIESKRRFNQALFIEIRSFLKSKEKKGDTQIKILADGTLKFPWDKIVNPEGPSSTLQGLWLRRQDSNL